MGGLSAVSSCSPADLGALTRYADALGLMFQILDDLLDVTQTTEHLGKAAGKGADKGKLTYPGLLGSENSPAEITRLQTEAHHALASLKADNAGVRNLRDLCDYMAVRQK